MPDNIRDIACSFAKQVREVYGSSLKRVLVYGSYARGDYSESSDIDIVAIVKGERLPLQEKLKKVWDDSAEIGLENDVIVSPMVIPYEEFQKYRTTLPYYRNIEMEAEFWQQKQQKTPAILDLRNKFGMQRAFYAEIWTHPNTNLLFWA